MTAVLDPTATGAPADPTPGVRRTWRVLASLAAVGLLFWGVTQFVDLLAHEERVEEHTFPAAGVDLLVVEVDSGSLDITAADVDVITVRARISDGLRGTGHREEVVSGRLELEATCHNYLGMFCSVDYDVQVPVGFDVVARMDNGRIQVVGTEGSVDATSSNGSIALVDVRGDISVSSDNGAIDGDGLVSAIVSARSSNGSIDLGFVEAPTIVEADSDNGSVEVRLPEVDGGYRVEQDTDNGSVDLGVATDPASVRHITVTSDNGDVRVLAVDGEPG
jgi:hypothetical protein